MWSRNIDTLRQPYVLYRYGDICPDLKCPNVDALVYPVLILTFFCSHTRIKKLWTDLFFPLQSLVMG